jgi:glycosyltransferase Alg8
LFLALYLLLFAALALHAPAAVWQPGTGAFIFVLGWVGVWRYSWGGVHLCRSLWYRCRVFPRWRRQADRLMAAGTSTAAELLAPEAFIVITSYRIPAETTAAAFGAAITEAARYPNPVTIVAAIVEMADQRLIKDLFRRLAPPPHVRLVLVRGPGTGKRDGLARALRAISLQGAPAQAVVIVQDGDAVLPPDCLMRTLPFFRLLPALAALTTDEDCVVPGAGPAMRAWHRLRFAQRHLLMSSMGLSRRLITLTGRMSAYRASVAIDPAFIETIQHDRLDHWRHGRLRLLTGEDKSAAFWLLAQGLDTLYVPDVQVLTIEHPPADDLVQASSALMLRWFGNMLRASGRCLALGPLRLGWFIWWCLLDQRISMWTPLIGPIGAILLSITVTPAFLYAYLLWVMATRLVQSLLLLTVRPTISGLYPPLLYYSQLYGALLKTWVLFRLDRQRWTRQNIGWARIQSSGRRRLQAAGSLGLHLLALAALTTAVALATGALALPNAATLGRLL